MTTPPRAIQVRGSWDDERSQPWPCANNRHWLTGRWTRLHCPLCPPHVGLWAQPDQQPLAE